MASLLITRIVPNNNMAHTDAFRTYVKDNFEELRSKCLVVEVAGRVTSRYKNKSHAMWIELGLDPKYCMIADLLNGITGSSNLNELTKVYLPETKELDALSRRINRKA